MKLEIKLDKDFEKLLEEIDEQYLKIEGLTKDKLDPTRFFKSFLSSGNVADASIDPNSNVNSQNMSTLLHESSKPHQKLLSFNKMYIELKEEFDIETANGAIRKHLEGDIVWHDSSGMSYLPYCYAYTLKDIAERGLFFINEMQAKAPQHLETFNAHVMETTAFLTNLQSGACGFPDYLLYSFYFWKKDVEEGYIDNNKAEQVKHQQFQKMIFESNQPYLKINQSAYTNWTILDREYFAGLFGGLEFPDGSWAMDYIEEFMQYQKDFLNYEKTLRRKHSFTYPVLTFSGVFKDNNWADEDMAKFVIRHNLDWADVNIYKSENPNALSACCRAEFNLGEIDGEKKGLKGNFNSIGGADLSIGSTKVIDINLARLGYKHKGDIKAVKKDIKKLVELIQKIHYVDRKVIKKNIDRGLLPNYTYGLMKLDRQYATIGIASMEEFVNFMGGIKENKIGEKSYTDEGIDYIGTITEYINELGENTLDDYGYTQSQEVSPNETQAGILLKKDRVYFEDYPVDKVVYSNQWCGLTSNFPLLERARVDGKLAEKMKGGNILHLNIGERWATFEDAWEFNLKVARLGAKYWSEIRKFQYCKNDHNFFSDTCPICGEKAKGDIIKIVGYLVKNEYYEEERREELENRKFYKNN